MNTLKNGGDIIFLHWHVPINNKFAIILKTLEFKNMAENYFNQSETKQTKFS